MRKKLVFKNTPWGDKILDPLVMKDWNYDGWFSVLTAEGCKPEPEPFHPTFVSAVAISGDRGEIRQPIETGMRDNFISYFATEATALELASRFKGKVVEVPYGLEGPALTIPTNCFAIEFPNGKVLNAGMLGSYFIRMPENVFSGAAEKAIRLLIDAK